MSACRSSTASPRPVRSPAATRARSPATREVAGGEARVLIMTTFDIDEYVYDALAAGASGFLLKDVGPEQLNGQSRVVAAGEARLAPTVTRRLIDELVRGGRRRLSTPPG